MILNYCFKRSSIKFTNFGFKNSLKNSMSYNFLNLQYSSFSTTEKTPTDKPKGNDFLDNVAKKTMKTDPHKAGIYSDTKVNFGIPAASQKFPDYLTKLAPVPSDQNYHYYDIPDSIKYAIKNNFPIIREPVSAYYSQHINGKTYHVFNAARVVRFIIY